MNPYDHARPRIDAILDRVRERVDGYPTHLRQLGAGFLDHAGPGYFSRPDAAPLLHLPLWMDRGLADEVVDDLLEATALAYAYVRIQDNVVDEPDTRGQTPLLLVANVLLWDALALWRRHTDARFEERARDAWVIFSEETESERRQMSQDAYPPERFVQHARKCALAEVPLYAVMSASGDWRGASEVGRLVHALALAYGRFNDVMGHARDLDGGARTFLLAQARVEAQRRGMAGSPDDIRGVLAQGDLQERFVDAAIADLTGSQIAAERIGIRGYPGFVAERCARLAAMRDRISLLRLAASLAA